MDVNFEKAENDWSPLIGRFIVDFVVIDDTMFHVIGSNSRRLNDKELDEIKEFKPRVKLFKKVMKTYLEPIDLAKLDKVMTKISDLYPIRNLLAHNSLTFAYEPIANGNLKPVGFQINGRKTGRSINITELKKKAKELASIRIHFSELSMAYYEAEFRLISQATKA